MFPFLQKNPLLRVVVGVIGSTLTAAIVWKFVLVPMNWPSASLVCRYLFETAKSPEMYLAFLMSGTRALISVVIGFSLALLLAIATGRTMIGWVLMFFLLLMLQKIPAVAMVHVLVGSKLGIGFQMTIVLASTVVLSFSWLVLHHRAKTLSSNEMFALRVTGFRGLELALYGLLPHMGSAIGGSARLAMSIAVIMVVIGEWQGVWADGSIWQYGLGVHISRSYEAIHSEARVIAACVWLGVLGVVLDGFVQLTLFVARRTLGVEFRR